MHPEIAKWKANLVEEKLESLAESRCASQHHWHLVSRDLLNDECPDVGPITQLIARYLEYADITERAGPFRFLDLDEHLRLLIYEEHFRDYTDSILLNDRVTYQRNKAGINLLFACRIIHNEAQLLLARNRKFIMTWNADDPSTIPNHNTYLDVANRLSIVGPNIADSIVSMRLDVYINLWGILLVDADWTGLRSMKKVESLDVAMNFPDEEQERWCRDNYERSLPLKALIEGLVAALPAQCVIRWRAPDIGYSPDMFVPPGLAELRRRINPYSSRTRSGFKSCHDVGMGGPAITSLEAGGERYANLRPTALYAQACADVCYSR